MRYFQINARSYAHDRPDEAIRAYNSMVLEQDRVVVENQRPEELPLDLSDELHLKGPDGMAVEYRRMLAELGIE